MDDGRGVARFRAVRDAKGWWQENSPVTLPSQRRQWTLSVQPSRATAYDNGYLAGDRGRSHL